MPVLERRSTPRAARLFLAIHETLYVVRPLSCDPSIAERAFQLHKADGTSYDVAQTRHGPQCDCPDFLYRRDGIDPEGCKHVKALVEHGLLAGNALPRAVDPAGRAS